MIPFSFQIGLVGQCPFFISQDPPPSESCLAATIILFRPLLNVFISSMMALPSCDLNQGLLSILDFEMTFGSSNQSLFLEPQHLLRLSPITIAICTPLQATLPFYQNSCPIFSSFVLLHIAFLYTEVLTTLFRPYLHS